MGSAAVRPRAADDRPESNTDAACAGRVAGEAARPRATIRPVVDWVVLVLGTALGIVSLTADLLGLGGFPGFGWKQALGTAVALVLIVGSALRIVRAERRRSGR